MMLLDAVISHLNFIKHGLKLLNIQKLFYRLNVVLVDWIISGIAWI